MLRTSTSTSTFQYSVLDGVLILNTSLLTIHIYIYRLIIVVYIVYVRRCAGQSTSPRGSAKLLASVGRWESRSASVSFGLFQSYNATQWPNQSKHTSHPPKIYLLLIVFYCGDPAHAFRWTQGILPFVFRQHCLQSTICSSYRHHWLIRRARPAVHQHHHHHHRQITVCLANNAMHRSTVSPTWSKIHR